MTAEAFPQGPIFGLTLTLVPCRCENSERWQGGSRSRGQLEKKREKAIVSEQGATAAGTHMHNGTKKPTALSNLF